MTASGYPARWNSKGRHVLYTAGTRALACLENVVHRSGEGLNGAFKVMLVEIPEIIRVEVLDVEQLPKNWHEYETYSYCQKIGNSWLDRAEAAVLKVPSAIIPREFNYLINVNHVDFKRINQIGLEDFKFDPRIKG